MNTDNETPDRDTQRPLRSWPLYFLAAPAGVAVWSGWVGLGELTGFGKVHPLPGIADGFTINTAITLPIGVEAYAAYALRVWLSNKPLSAETLKFARRSAIGALVLGALGQIAYHLLAAAKAPHAPMWVTTIVACFPVAVLGLGTTLAHLVHRDARIPNDAGEPEQDVVPSFQDASETPQVTPTSVTQASGSDPAQVTPRAVTQATHEEVTQGTSQVTSEAMTQDTPEVTPEVTPGAVTQATSKSQGQVTRKSPPKPRQKSRTKPRTDAELIAELEEIVADHYRSHPGQEINVKPVAQQLGIGRDRARRLLDQMNVRPIRKAN
jgi:hypothetical protein